MPLLLALTGASGAHAASVAFSPLDLARGELYLQEDPGLDDDEAATLTIPGVPGTCTVSYSGGAIFSSGPGTCPGLWAMVDIKAFSATLSAGGGSDTLSFTPTLVPQTKAFALSGTDVVIPSGVPELVEVAILMWEGDVSAPRPSGWQAVSVEDGKITLGQPTATVAQKAGGRFFVVGFDPNAEDFQPLAWQVLAANTPVSGTSGATPATPSPPLPPVRPGPIGPTGSTTIAATNVEPEGYTVEMDPPSNDIAGFTLQALGPGEPIPKDLACPPSRLPQDDMTVVCVDATGPVLRYWQTPRTRFTKPNRPFYVHVVHRHDHRVSLVMGGTIGSYTPGSRGRFVMSSTGGEGFNLEGDRGRPVTYYVTARTFAPRKPGFTPLEVRVLDAQNQLVADPLKVEFWIEATYSGAFRVGIAGILMGALDERYRAETRPGSQQREIVQQGGSVMDLDVVIGYSPYLDAGGRAGSGCESAPFCFNPYFGLGLLSASSGGDLQWLKSVHLGVEWELTEAFAIGLTANLRRVERLARGFAPGYPVDGDVPTDDKFVFGVGLVINLSPEFLKVGASGAAAVLR